VVGGVIILLLVLLGCVQESANYGHVEKKEESVANITTKPEFQDILQRLCALEPEQPKTITDDLNRRQVKQFLEQNQLNSIQDIRSLGRKVPFKITSEDDTWVRPVYSEAWHSTFMGGKYSNVSRLISYAQRNLFVYTGGLSEGAGLYYGLGFPENWGKPVGSSFNSLSSFELWLVNRKVKEIIRLGNEWLVVAEPQLQGYQTVRINYHDAGMKVNETTKVQLMLFRMVTPDGYELERTARFLPAR